MEKELIVVYNGTALLKEEVSSKIAEFEKTMKEMKKKEDELREQILREMEEKGIKCVDSKEITITYKYPSTRETFDSKKFKEEHQDLYDEFINISNIKSSISIKLKDE